MNDSEYDIYSREVSDVRHQMDGRKEGDVVKWKSGKVDMGKKGESNQEKWEQKGEKGTNRRGRRIK
jgi:hypothetical protein